MSRQNKQARNAIRKKAFSMGRKSGNPGPKQTTPKHNKKRTKWNSPEAIKARAAILGKFSNDKETESSLKNAENRKKYKNNLNKVSEDS